MTSGKNTDLETPVVLQSQSQRLVGMLHAADSKKMLVLCHGFTQNKIEHNRLFVEAARVFSQNSYNALRFDFYGSGDSEGDFSDSLFSTYRQNILDVVSWCRSKGYGEPALLGLSMGAAAAICAVDEIDVHALITWSAVPDFKTLFEAKIDNPQQLNRSGKVYEYEGWLLKSDFLADALQYDIEAAFQGITIPKLVVQGSGDEALFVNGFNRFREIAQPPADFMEIPQANHAFQKPAHRRQVIKQTLTWLKRHF